MRTTLYILATLFLLYVVGDYATTIYAVSLSPAGINSEMNPVGALLFNAMGQIGLLLSKLIIFGFIVISTYYAVKRGRRPRLTMYTLYGFGIYSAIILGINIYTIHSFLST